MADQVQVKPETMNFVCPGCNNRFTNVEFGAHYDTCANVVGLSNSKKSMHWNQFLSKKYLHDVSQLVPALAFSNLSIPRGKKYPTIPCLCEDAQGHTQEECIRKLREPEMRAKATALMKLAMEHNEKYELLSVEIVCDESSSRQNQICTNYFPNMEEREIAAMIGRGYRTYIEELNGSVMHALVLHMNKKVTSAENAAVNIKSFMKHCQQQLEIHVENLVKVNAATLEEWDKRWEEKQKKSGNTSDTDTDNSTESSSSKRPRRR